MRSFRLTQFDTNEIRFVSLKSLKYLYKIDKGYIAKLYKIKEKL